MERFKLKKIHFIGSISSIHETSVRFKVDGILKRDLFRTLSKIYKGTITA